MNAEGVVMMRGVETTRRVIAKEVVAARRFKTRNKVAISREVDNSSSDSKEVVTIRVIVTIGEKVTARGVITVRERVMRRV